MEWLLVADIKRCSRLWQDFIVLQSHCSCPGKCIIEGCESVSLSENHYKDGVEGGVAVCSEKLLWFQFYCSFNGPRSKIYHLLTFHHTFTNRHFKRFCTINMFIFLFVSCLHERNFKVCGWKLVNLPTFSLREKKKLWKVDLKKPNRFDLFQYLGRLCKLSKVWLWSVGQKINWILASLFMVNTDPFLWYV